MKKLVSEQKIVVVLFVLVLIIFTVAQKETQKLYPVYTITHQSDRPVAVANHPLVSNSGNQLRTIKN